MKKKLFFLWALLLSVIGANAQNWTWTGEDIASNGYYLFNRQNSVFLGKGSVSSTPSVLWNATYDNGKVTFENDKDYIWIDVSKNGSNIKSVTINTTGTASGDGASSNLSVAGSSSGYQFYHNRSWDYWGTRYGAGFIAYNGSSITSVNVSGSNNPSTTDNNTYWLLISKVQKTAYDNYIAAWNTANNHKEHAIPAEAKSKLTAALAAATNYSNAEARTNELNALSAFCDNYQNNISAWNTNKESATKDNGVDASFFLINPEAEYGIGCWTCPNGCGVLGGDNAHFFEPAGWWKSNSSMSQTVTDLPNGNYVLSMKYQASEHVKVTLSGNTSSNYVQGTNEGWKDLNVECKVTDGTLNITASSVVTDGETQYTWFNTDNFTLTYYGFSLDEAYKDLAAALEECKPWDDKSYDTYTTIKAAYDGKTYTTEEEINTAISNLKAAYDTFCWDNASMEHPYLVEGIISRADCADNTPWSGTGRTTATGQHWSGDASRDYFTQNHENGAARAQTVTIPNAGVYMLKTSVRIVGNGGYATISVGDETETTTSPVQTTGGTIATDGTEYASVAAGKAAGATFANNNNGYGWVYNKITFATTTANEQKTISIALSNENVGHEADCGGMFLYYIGNKGTLTEDGDVITGMGNFNNETITAKANTTTIDLTGATGSFTIDATANPNVLVYTKGATVNGVTKNIVNNGTCANLVLTDGYPFKATKNFEATSAKYTMGSVATTSAGKTFGTLMVPFAVSGVPTDNTTYALTEVAFGEEIHAGTVDAIAANTPVLVTKRGDYTARNVVVAATNDTYINGELVGTYKAMTAPANSYVLQKHDTRVAFFLVDAEGTPTKPTVNPFRAYIKEQQANNVKALNIFFDDEETGVGSLTTDNGQQTTVYDLSGRKVSKAQKGVYIINGKKVMK